VQASAFWHWLSLAALKEALSPHHRAGAQVDADHL
jgi:hypothetical protein